MRTNFEHTWYQVTFRIFVTEIAVIQELFFTVVLNKKNKTVEKHKNGIPWHVHTIQSQLFSKPGSPIFILIGSCLDKVFPIILARQS